MKTILVIEDEDRVRDTIKDILELEGFNAIVAADGKSGLQQAQTCKPDLILCDVMMPELDGYGVLTALQQHSKTATIPFIFLTACATRSALRQGMELGADDYLTKPFTPDELRRAIAVRFAKKAIGNGNITVQDIQQLATALRSGIEQQEFQLYYQPQLDLQTGKIIGAEALLRWQHPELGAVSPSKFIPVAEATGFIIELGKWVLETACTQARYWYDQNPILQHVAVNLSAYQFCAPDLVDTIAQILAKTGLAAQQLDLELTETSLMADTEAAIKTLNQLREIGVKISIDDFGTGYSSLQYLQQFPFNTLKIDRCFVQDIDQNPGNAAITTAMIAMAHDLHLNVIGEGVETQAELNFLRHYHCDAIQGYLISPPLPAEKFDTFLYTSSALVGLDNRQFLPGEGLRGGLKSPKTGRKTPQIPLNPP